MQGKEKLDKLFFEFASESRLGILQELKVHPLRMQQVARKLNLTDTETVRQLRRLCEALIISKQPDGTYSISNYGLLAMNFFAPIEFTLNHREFFLQHDFWVLPYTLINRLGELSGAEFCTEAVSGFNRVRQMVSAAEKYFWAVYEQRDSSHIETLEEKVSRGLEIKLLMQKELAKTLANTEEVYAPTKRRYMERVPVLTICTENEATVVFRRLNGAFDYSIGLFGTDDKFRKWCTDAFNYFWERAERWYPGIKIS